MARACIFCGVEGSATAEHVFPNWLNSIFPADEVGPTDVHRVLVEPDVPRLYRSYTKDDVASLTTKHVCGQCNNGWMSKLEDDAKPVLVPLVQGVTRSLTMAEQLLLAAWAVKTAMVLETTWAKDPFTTDGERRTVYLEQRPPAHYRVWTAAYQGPVGPLRSTHLIATIDWRAGGPVGTMLLVSIQIGALVFQVATGTGQVPIGAGVEAIGQVLPDRLQLFPPVPTLSWPPRQVLDDEGYVAASQNPGLLVPGVAPLNVVGLHDLSGG